MRSLLQFWIWNLNRQSADPGGFTYTRFCRPLHKHLWEPSTRFLACLTQYMYKKQFKFLLNSLPIPIPRFSGFWLSQPARRHCCCLLPRIHFPGDGPDQALPRHCSGVIFPAIIKTWPQHGAWRFLGRKWLLVHLSVSGSGMWHVVRKGQISSLEAPSSLWQPIKPLHCSVPKLRGGHTWVWPSWVHKRLEMPYWV